MPIGIPRVGYRLPGDESAQWVDIYNRLYRERVLFLGSELNDELANQLIALLIYLGAEDASKRIFMYINSPGGSLIAGLGVHDAINHSGAPITTIGIGNIASMASFILCSGDKNNRISLPHTRVMIHQPNTGNLGAAAEVMSTTMEVVRMRNSVVELYAKQTGQSVSTIARDLDRDRYLGAQEAKTYGLVDLIVDKYEQVPGAA